ncbi:MAG TPA: dihydrolipoamide acetyltransferase family protein [Actinomycetota bacterium]|jgi:2-oxoglutarate dehydrogenase E2 component (dihydrolipoamide succinyltransferase)
MVTEVKMPQLGETVVEGTITRWLKHEGDPIEADESLVEVSTDKVDSEIPSPASGVIARLRASEGETVGVGSVIAEIAAPGEKASTEPVSAEPAPAVTPPPERAPEASIPQPGPRQPEASPPPEPEAPRRVREVAASPPPMSRPAVPAAAAPGVKPSADEPRRGILSPLVRRLAAELQLDLEQVRGSGTGGRITKQDVLAFAESGRAARAAAPAVPPAPAAPAAGPPAADGAAPASYVGPPPSAPAPAPVPRPAVAASGGEETIQIGHMRRLIADHMVRSNLESARAWTSVEVDLGRVGRLRELAGPAFKQREGFSLTWMPFVSKATTLALLGFPQVNASWNGDGTITQKRYVNLGIAVALPQGLIVPVIKGADAMNLVGLARAIRDIADRARNKRLSPDEVQGGSFTITNPGPFGSLLSVPIINQGQTGILSFDAVTRRVVVVTDEAGNDLVAIRPMVFISMSWDHRVIDGAEATRFLGQVKALLEQGDFSADLAGYIGGGVSPAAPPPA